MSEFSRSYLLTLSSIIRTPPDPSRPYNLSVEEGFEGVPRSIEEFKVTELRISAKISDTLSNSNSKNTEIKIYNATKDILAKLKKPNVYLTLAAGYSIDTVTRLVTPPEDLPTIFTGEVISMETVKENADFITTIMAKESEVTIRDSYISQVYIGGQTISYILEDMVNNWMPRVSIGQISLGPIFIPKQRLNNSYLAYGRVDSVLKELAADFGFIYYYVGNKFYAQSENFGRARNVVTITPKNVVGDLLPAISTNNSASAVNTKAGLKFKVFLNGRLDIQARVKIEGFPEDKNGDYKIIDIIHELDTRGEEWHSALVVEGV